jgi:hypothetical protein
MKTIQPILSGKQYKASLTVFLIITIVLQISVQAAVPGTYPIDPRPLRRLVLESEYIISGYVMDIYSCKKEKEDDWVSMVARVKISEQMQGKIDEEEIEILFNPGFICPAPPHYEKGTYVLAFLERQKGKFTTHALSYGSKTLSPAEIGIYKDRIVEIQKINKMDDGLDKFEQTVEWLVKCAEQQATRWEGTYELSPESDFMSFYSQAELKDFRSMLTAEQRSRLKSVLLQNELLGYVDFGLVDLVYRNNEKEVEQLLIRNLKKIDDNNLWMADSYMSRLAHRDQSGRASDLLKKMQKKQMELGHEGAMQRIVKEFIAVVDK